MTTQNNTQNAPTTQEDLKAELERLRKENERLKAAPKGVGDGKLSMKISEKGAVSIYGLGRFPVTLYPEQWRKLVAPEVTTEIIKFIDENEAAGKFPSEEERLKNKAAAKERSDEAIKKLKGGETQQAA